MPAVKRVAPKRRPTATRPARQLTGKGAYRAKPQAKKAKRVNNYEPSLGRSLLTEGGSLLGGVFGMPGLGKAAGSALSNIFGMGSYEVKENIFMEGRLPQMINMPTGGGTVIRFQEYLGDVITSSTPGIFNINSWVINAANRDTFPFIAQIAVNYEQYQIEGLVFEFRSTSGNALNSTNTALGSVLLGTQYDVADAPFASKAEMLNHEYSNSVKPSENCLHMIECAPGQTSIPILYTLDGTNPANTDARLYHLGRFSVATIGFQAASVRIGEIHCTYQIRMLKPKLYSALGLDDDMFMMTNSAWAAATPLGNTATRVVSLNNFNITPGTANILIPASSLVKNYRFEIEWVGAGAAAFVCPTPAVSSGSTIQLIAYYPNAGVSTTNATLHFSITTAGDNNNCNVTFTTGGTLPSGAGYCNVRVLEVPSAL